MEAQVRSLALPDQLQGSWTSVVIGSYGANLSFFEQRLLGQLAQIPLRIVLADAEQLGIVLHAAAESGQPLRGANRSYLAAPIRHHHAAHAKVILLLGPTAGRLIVGSGNLGYDGYASSGELWHVYAYSADSATHLQEFAAARAFLDALGARGQLDAPTVDLLGTVWGQSPWIPDTVLGAPAIRSNLDVALIDQLEAAIDFQVQQLTAYAPFHDATCEALAELIRRFKPRTVRVLVARDTSVDPTKLGKVLAAHPKAVHEIGVAAAPGTYLHAKWVHLVGAQKEVLLTGSANLSRSALLRSADLGNIEVGVLTLGGRGAFEPLYAPLNLAPVKDLAGLRLSRQPDSSPAEEVDHPLVVWSRLDGARLTLAFDRAVDDVAALGLSTLHGPLAFTVIGHDEDMVVVEFDAASAEWVSSGGPVFVALGGDGENVSETWPYQVGAMQARLERSAQRDVLARAGELPEQDTELYALLQELEQTLIFDARTTWRAAGVNPTTPAEPDSEVETVRWQDLDWARVRRDPRYRGYFYAGARPGAAPTDIQVLLAAISGRLSGLDTQVPGIDIEHPDEDEDLAREADSARADEDIDDDEYDDELERRRLPISTRTRMAFSRFVARYAAATRDAGFVDQLGPVVTVHNAAIFSHVLTQLMVRDAVDVTKAVDAQLTLWSLLWGAADRPGLLAGLDDEERAAAEEVLTAAQTRRQTLLALAGSYQHQLPDLAARLREATSHLIVDAEFGLDDDLIAAAAPDPDEAVTLISTLICLASEFTERELIGSVIEPFGLLSPAAAWRLESVFRGGTKQPQLVLVVSKPVASLDHDGIRGALERLAVAAYLSDRPYDYLRIRFEGNGSDVGFWDEAEQELCTMTGGVDLSRPTFTPAWPEWLTLLEELLHAIPRAAAA